MRGNGVIALFDESRSYRALIERLHGGDLHCPNSHPLPAEQAPHDHSRTPIVSYRCRECGAVFNLFTGTAWCGTHYDCTTVLLVLRGLEEEVSTPKLADLLNVDYSALLQRRRHLRRCQKEGIPTGLRKEKQVAASDIVRM